MEFDLCVFELRFESPPDLSRAYALVSEHARVSSCLVESSNLRIRLLADRHGCNRLLESVYEHGGLVWCKRYPLGSEPEVVVDGAVG